MPRRRAVRLIGASLVAVAVPGVSPRVSRAMIAAGAKCPDGSTCTDPKAPTCCSEKPSPLSGSYTCRGPTQICCCGNTQCDAATERCVCPVGHGNPGGQCAPKCALEYGHGWKDCGLDCCPPYKECENGECVSCEDKGKKTCSSYDNKSSHECCARGTECCADMTSTDCCGPKQTCKPAGRNHVTCKCNRTTDTKCGSDCCKPGQFCLTRLEEVDDFIQVTRTCKPRCRGTKCGVGICCGPGMKCTRGRCLVK